MTTTTNLISVPNFVPATLAEERALSLLGAGISPVHVASTIGVSESFISQLLSREDFASAVAHLKTEALQKHNSRDLKYDSLEDSLLGKLEQALPMMYKPHDILRAISTINGAKRRGTSTIDSVVAQQTIVQIVLPTKVVSQFTVNAQNQVVQAGTQSLQTIQSGELLRQHESLTLREEIKNVLPITIAEGTIAPTGETNDPLDI